MKLEKLKDLVLLSGQLDARRCTRIMNSEKNVGNFHHKMVQKRAKRVSFDQNVRSGRMGGGTLPPLNGKNPPSSILRLPSLNV